MLGVEVHSPTLNKQLDLMLHKYGCIWNAQKFVPNIQQPKSTVRLQQHLKTYHFLTEPLLSFSLLMSEWVTLT